jgi:hypothetical protein
MKHENKEHVFQNQVSFTDDGAGAGVSRAGCNTAFSDRRTESKRLPHLARPRRCLARLLLSCRFQPLRLWSKDSASKQASSGRRGRDRGGEKRRGTQPRLRPPLASIVFENVCDAARVQNCESRQTESRVSPHLKHSLLSVHRGFSRTRLTSRRPLVQLPILLGLGKRFSEPSQMAQRTAACFWMGFAT